MADFHVLYHQCPHYGDHSVLGTELTGLYRFGRITTDSEPELPEKCAVCGKAIWFRINEYRRGTGGEEYAFYHARKKAGKAKKNPILTERQLTFLRLAETGTCFAEVRDILRRKGWSGDGMAIGPTFARLGGAPETTVAKEKPTLPYLKRTGKRGSYNYQLTAEGMCHLIWQTWKPKCNEEEHVWFPMLREDDDKFASLAIFADWLEDKGDETAERIRNLLERVS